MTRVDIVKKSGHIVKVKALGHTDFAVEGEDIVCAALSSIMQTALLGLLQVAAIPLDFKRDGEEGYLEFCLSEGIDAEQRKTADIILATMLLGINDLSENFSKFIKVKITNKEVIQ